MSLDDLVTLRARRVELRKEFEERLRATLAEADEQINELVRKLYAQGFKKSEIAQAYGTKDRNTINRILNATPTPVPPATPAPNPPVPPATPNAPANTPSTPPTGADVVLTPTADEGVFTLTLGTRTARVEWHPEVGEFFTLEGDYGLANLPGLPRP